MSALTYKGYIATLDYEEDTKSFFGRVVNTRDIITFHGASVADLQNEFQTSVDAHISFCEEQGINPSKPYSGRFVVRVDPNLHRRVEAATHVTGAKSMNAFVSEALERMVSEVENQK